MECKTAIFLNIFIITYWFTFQATKAFLDALSETGAACVSRATAIKFLLARKFDVARAHTLWRQHEATRRREGLIKFEPFEDPLKSELETGKFTILVRYSIRSYLFYNVVSSRNRNKNCKDFKYMVKTTISLTVRWLTIKS